MSAAIVIPSGGTIVQTFKSSFSDVPVDADKGNAIATTQFLDAAESLTTIFDCLGSVAFSPVKSDLIGNIQKIRKQHLAAPFKSENIQDLCRNELQSKKHAATEGLLWLVRGLDFTSIALSQNISRPSEEISDSFRSAYSRTLKAHHSFIIKPIFNAAMSACPYRKDFYAKLGSDEGSVRADLVGYLEALDRIVSILKDFLSSKEAKW